MIPPMMIPPMMIPPMVPMRFQFFWKCVLAFGAVFMLAACASSDEDTGTYIDEEVQLTDQPAAELYNLAMDTLLEGDIKAAVESFDAVERQHPYSVWATKAQLMSAYSYYLRNDYDDAIAGLDRFIHLHPGHSDTPYAYYLKALSYYEQISDVRRDQKMTEKAAEALQTLVRRFPESKYARNARLKLEFTHNQLAGKEMEVGRYYLKRGNYLAAIKRFRGVVERYQNTAQAPEALHRLTESYIALGLISEARKSAAVLGHNFPGSPWYQDSYDLFAKKRLRPVLAGNPPPNKPRK